MKMVTNRLCFCSGGGGGGDVFQVGGGGACGGCDTNLNEALLCHNATTILTGIHWVRYWCACNVMTIRRNLYSWMRCDVAFKCQYYQHQRKNKLYTQQPHHHKTHNTAQHNNKLHTKLIKSHSERTSLNSIIRPHSHAQQITETKLIPLHTNRPLGFVDKIHSSLEFFLVIILREAYTFL